MKKILTALLFPTIVLSQTTKEVERDRLFRTPSPESLSPGDLNANEEVFLFNESLLTEDKGGYNEAFYTGNDDNRFSLGYQFSTNYEDFTELSSLEIIFSKQLQRYSEVWISGILKRTTGKYKAMAEEIQTSNGDVKRSDSQQSFTTVGVGGGYRFKALAKAWGTDRIFETIDAYLTYNRHLDGATDERYQGFGMLADYGLHYRSTESFYYGGKLSYNIAALERPAEDDEKLQDRSLVFGWLALGFELGYYY